jgi:uncharacterized protein (TIGR03086 family)
MGAAVAGGEHLESPQAGLADAVNVTQAGGDPLALLSRALDQTGALIFRIRPDQATLPTPCQPWDVRALIEHVLQDVQRFRVRASGGEWKESDADVIGDDWPGAYREAADSLLRAWGRDGALDATVKLPFGDFPASWFVGQQITDLVVHGWDVAKATGESTEFDPELARLALDWGKENLRPEFRGRDFGPEVAVPERAPLHDRLAGFFGRDPKWTPSRT